MNFRAGIAKKFEMMVAIFSLYIVIAATAEQPDVGKRLRFFIPVTGFHEYGVAVATPGIGAGIARVVGKIKS